jgi:hypothetical protein
MRRPVAVGIAGLLVAGMLGMVAGIQAQFAEGADGAIYTITPPSQVVQSDAAEVAVQVTVEDVDNLGAFEFRMVYDPAVLTFKEVRRGPFIGSTGRGVTCPRAATDGSSVQYGCNTTGYPRPGPGGSGLVATVAFVPKAPGTSPLVFNKVEFADATDDADSITAGTPKEAAVQVVGPDDDTNQPPPATPTHDARLLTPTPADGAPTDDNTYRLTDPQDPDDDTSPDRTPAAGTIGADDGGAVSGSGGASAGGSEGSSAVQGSTSSGSGAGGSSRSGSAIAGSNFPVAGYGATVATVELVARLPLAGRILLCAGIALVAGGALARRREGRRL